MESHCYNGRGDITLTFKVGTDLDAALLRVSNKLDDVPEYPENVEKPVMSATGASSSPVIWMTLKTLPGNKRDINTYRTYFEDEVRQYIEGVGDLFVFSGRETEIHVNVEPVKLAAYDLTIGEVAKRIKEENQNISAGLMDVSKKSFRVRTTGQYRKPKDLYSVVLRDTGDQRVFLKDVAEITPGYEVLHESVMQNGATTIAIGVKKEPGANVLTLTKDMKKDGIPRIKNIFFVASERLTLFGAMAEDMRKVKGIIPLCQRMVHHIPGVFGVVSQMGIFEIRLGRGRTVVVNITGKHLGEPVRASRTILEVAYPEANFIPDRERLAANGLSAEELGTAIDVLMDGRKIDEFKRKGLTSLDLILTSGDKLLRTPKELEDTLIATLMGALCP